MTTNPNRVSKGVPTGGQFAASERGETDLPLADLPAERDAVLADYYTAIDEDEYVVSPGGRVRVCLTDIGEGWDGEYDENDENDEPLLRMDVQVRSDSPLAVDPVDESAAAGDADHGWSWAEGGSFCTRVNAAKVTGVERAALCHLAADDFERAEQAGRGFSGFADNYSLASIDDAYVV